MSESNSCCGCCTSFIFSLGLTALFLWVSLRPSSPTFSIQNFYVPALNTASNTTINTTINTTTVAIDFRIENTNKYKGIYYDALNVTLYYSPNLNFPVVGNASIPEFYQGFKKTAVKEATLQEVKIPWGEAVKRVYSNGTVDFRVDLATAVRYKIFGRKTGRHWMSVHGDVNVDKQGKQTEKKRIHMKSAAPDCGCRRSSFYGAMAFFFVLLSTDSLHVCTVLF